MIIKNKAAVVFALVVLIFQSGALFCQTTQNKYEWAKTNDTKIVPATTYVPQELGIYSYNLDILKADYAEGVRQAQLDPDKYFSNIITQLYTERSPIKRMALSKVLSTLCLQKKISEQVLLELVPNVINKLKEKYNDAKAQEDAGFFIGALNYLFNIYDADSKNVVPSLIQLLGDVGGNYGENYVGLEGIRVLRNIAATDLLSIYFPDAVMALARIQGELASNSLALILQQNSRSSYKKYEGESVIPIISEDFEQIRYENAQAAIVLILAARGEKNIVWGLYEQGVGGCVVKNTMAQYLGKQIPYPNYKLFRNIGIGADIFANILFMAMSPAAPAEMVQGGEFTIGANVAKNAGTAAAGGGKVIEFIPNVAPSTTKIAASAGELRVGGGLTGVAQKAFDGTAALKLEPAFIPEVVPTPQTIRVMDKSRELIKDISLGKYIFGAGKVILIGDQVGSFVLDPDRNTIATVKNIPFNKVANYDKIDVKVTWGNGDVSKYRTFVPQGEGQQEKQKITTKVEKIAPLINPSPRFEIETTVPVIKDIPSPAEIIQQNQEMESVTLNITKRNGDKLTYIIKISKGEKGEEELQQLLAHYKTLGEVNVSSSTYDKDGKLINKIVSPYNVNNNSSGISPQNNSLDNSSVDTVEAVESVPPSSTEVSTKQDLLAAARELESKDYDFASIVGRFDDTTRALAAAFGNGAGGIDFDKLEKKFPSDIWEYYKAFSTQGLEEYLFTKYSTVEDKQKYFKDMLARVDRIVAINRVLTENPNLITTPGEYNVVVVNLKNEKTAVVIGTVTAKHHNLMEIAELVSGSEIQEGLAGELSVDKNLKIDQLAGIAGVVGGDHKDARFAKSSAHKLKDALQKAYVFNLSDNIIPKEFNVNKDVKDQHLTNRNDLEILADLRHSMRTLETGIASMYDYVEDGTIEFKEYVDMVTVPTTRTPVPLYEKLSRLVDTVIAHHIDVDMSLDQLHTLSLYLYYIKNRVSPIDLSQEETVKRIALLTKKFSDGYQKQARYQIIYPLAK